MKAYLNYNESSEIENFFNENILEDVNDFLILNSLLKDEFDPNLHFSKSNSAIRFQNDSEKISLLEYVLTRTNGEKVKGDLMYPMDVLGGVKWPSTLKELNELNPVANNFEQYEEKSVYEKSYVKNVREYFAQQLLIHKIIAKGVNPWSYVEKGELPTEVTELILSDNLEALEKIMKLPGAMSYSEVLMKPIDPQGVKRFDKAFPTVWHYLCHQKSLGKNFYVVDSQERNSIQILSHVLSIGVLPPDSFKESIEHPVYSSSPSALKLFMDYDYFESKPKLKKIIEAAWKSGKGFVRDYPVELISKSILMMSEYESDSSSVSPESLVISQMLSLKKNNSLFASFRVEANFNDFYNTHNFKTVHNFNEQFVGDWSVEAVYLHLFLEKNQTYFSYFDTKTLNKIKDIPLVNGEFSFNTLLIPFMSQEDCFNIDRKEVDKIKNYFNYIFKSSSNKKFNLNSLKTLNNYCERIKNDSFRDELLLSFFKSAFLENRKLKYLGESFANPDNLFHSVVETKLFGVLKEANDSGVSTFEVLSKHPNLDLIYASLLLNEKEDSRALRAIATKEFKTDTHIKPGAFLINYYSLLPNIHVLHSLISPSFFENFPELKKIKTEMDIKKNLSSSVQSISNHRF